MKRFLFLLILACGIAPFASAQDYAGSSWYEHVQLGAFGEYIHPTFGGSNDFTGLGARLGFMGYKNLMFEAQMSYDFEQTYVETSSNGITVNTANTGIRILHGEFGPKVNLGHWPVHPFITVKGGGIDYLVGRAPASFGSFTGSFSNLRANNVNAVLYGGTGIEGHWGPFGLRADVGDEIIFFRGEQNNLVVTFGPYIRF